MNENLVILVVEDNDEDFEMLTLALEKARVRNRVVRCCDGKEALDYLHKKTDDTQSPGLILLDLNLSGFDGRYVLGKLKEDQYLKSIPVIVFTTSANPKDVEYCYKTGISGYMLKPVDLNKFEDLILSFKTFWLENMVLPGEIGLR